MAPLSSSLAAAGGWAASCASAGRAARPLQAAEALIKQQKYAEAGERLRAAAAVGRERGHRVQHQRADTGRPELAPESAGLLAASLGLSRMHADDLEQLEAGMGIYDAFYRWCRDAVGEGHDWPPARKL